MPPPQQAYVPQYAPPSDDYTDATAPQSRTFKILQGLMQNDGKALGLGFASGYLGWHSV